MDPYEKCDYLTCLSPPPPNNHLYEITYVIGKKPFNMVDNSASKPLESTPIELPCITIDNRRIA